MSHGNISPRQKMINLMYLVLMALLAMNVSAEILNAFSLINESLVKTSKNIEKKNDDVMAKFEALNRDNPVVVGPWKTKADEVKALSAELSEYVQSLQEEIVEKAEGTLELYNDEEHGGVASIKKKDDNNVPAEIMILNKKGIDLKEKLNSYRDKLKSYVVKPEKNASLLNSIDATFNTEDIEGHEGNLVPWESANFEHLPLVAVITMLTKMETDIKNAESNILTHLLAQVDAGTWKFNKIEAIVKPDNNYVLVGEEYRAEVFIAASDSTQKPSILVGGRALTVEKGKGIYKGATGSAGIKKYSGAIRLKSPVTGDTVEYPFAGEYQVAVPSVSVSPTKMNVFYVGVDNPVDITAAGVPADKLSATISNGSISKTSNGYVVRVKRFGKATVRVTADGRSLGSKEFRVKKVPDPVAVIGSDKNNWKGGVMPKTTLTALRGIRAVMENFDFNLKFNIVSFNITCNINGFDESAKSKSGTITSQQKNIIRKAERRSRVIIEDVRAKGPDGTIRKLNDIVLKLR